MKPQEDFEKDKEGIQDASVSDFLLPYLLGRLPMGASAPATGLAEDAAGTELRDGLMKSMSEPSKGYAMGGVVTPDLGDVPLPGQPPANVPQGTMPSPIQGILAQSQGLGAQMAGQYTPQMRNQLYAAMLERQNSMPNAVGGGLASIGDAIARGYGHSNSDFLNQSQKLNKESVEGGLGAFDTGSKMNMQQTQAGMELGKMDPTSEISKIHQEAFREALKSLKYTDVQINKMPASQIEMLAQVGLKRADIDAQKELKEATLQLQSMLGSATIRNQQGERAQRQQQINKEADKEASTHYLSHPFKASEARSRLAEGSTAGEETAPHGATVTQNGHTYMWNAAKKKYE